MSETGGISAESYAIPIIGALSEAGSAYAQAGAISAQGTMTAANAEYNAAISRLRAKEATQEGEFVAGEVGRATKQLIGEQKASAGAQGITQDSISGLIAGSEAQGAIDEMTVRSNAWRKAWGLEAQATEEEVAGRMAKSGAEFGSRSTLITGGLRGLREGTRDYYTINRENILAEKSLKKGKPNG